ncbi:MAG: hypothetical protein JRI31_11495 [Deltaproteobacteria bacterium]|nr:hypothetical protein [Deltaproteobacteria bacterium]
MESRVFIDSNFWVYALTESRRKEDLIKRQSVLNLLQLQDKTFIVSVQVLNEVHWNFVKKFNFKDDEAYYLIEKGIKAVSRVVPLRDVTLP